MSIGSISLQQEMHVHGIYGDTKSRLIHWERQRKKNIVTSYNSINCLLHTYCYDVIERSFSLSFIITQKIKWIFWRDKKNKNKINLNLNTVFKLNGNVFNIHTCIVPIYVNSTYFAHVYKTYTNGLRKFVHKTFLQGYLKQMGYYLLWIKS